MRREVEGDVAIAAPSIFDAGAFELRKHFEHVAAHGFGHAAGVVYPFAVFAAEKQTAIGAEAVVIENVAVVAHGHIVAD